MAQRNNHHPPPAAKASIILPTYNEKDNIVELVQTIHKYLVSSNFRQAFFEFLKQLGCFGTACLYEEKGKKVPLVFTCFHIKDVFISSAGYIKVAGLARSHG